MGQISRRELLKGIGAGGAALALPGVAAAAREREDASLDTLNWALGATIRSLDFVHSYDFTTAIVLSLGLEGLLTYGNDGSLKPNLASSWSHPDALTYVYKLRPGVKFWDGSPLTAEDVVFSMSQHTQKAVGSQLASYYASVKSIT